MAQTASGRDRSSAVANGLAHKLRNSLNTMRTHIALLQKFTAGASDERVPRQLSKLEESVVGVEEILREFLTYASPVASEWVEAQLPSVVREVLNFVAEDLAHGSVQVCEEYSPNLPDVYVDESKLKRALLNLVVNARQAMPNGGTLTIGARASKHGYVLLEIADTGCGIPEAEQARIFQPFFTTKPEGLGLGLALVRRTIDDMHGRVRFQSLPGAGTVFRLFLPSAGRCRAALERAQQRREWLKTV